MPISENKKQSNRKWDAKNMATLGVRLRKTDADLFREYAEAQGKTVNTVLREYIFSCIDRDSRE